MQSFGSLGLTRFGCNFFLPGDGEGEQVESVLWGDGEGLDSSYIVVVGNVSPALAKFAR